MMKYAEYIAGNIPYMFRKGTTAPKIHMKSHGEDAEGFEQAKEPKEL